MCCVCKHGQKHPSYGIAARTCPILGHGGRAECSADGASRKGPLPLRLLPPKPVRACFSPRAIAMSTL